MWGLIPVAGEGSRLRSVTEGAPKCLVEVEGRPLIHHLLDRLEAACSRPCVVVPGEDELIRRALRSHPFGREASVVVQAEPRGLRDAVSQALAVVSPPTLLVMGDSYFAQGFQEVLSGRGAGEGGLLVEGAGTDPGEPAGWVVADRDGCATRLWKGSPVSPDAQRVAGGFVLEDRVFGLLGTRPGTGSFEATLDEAIQAGARYRLLAVSGPRWNVNTPGQLESLRAWARAQAVADATPVRR